MGLSYDDILIIVPWFGATSIRASEWEGISNQSSHQQTRRLNNTEDHVKSIDPIDHGSIYSTDIASISFEGSSCWMSGHFCIEMRPGLLRPKA